MISSIVHIAHEYDDDNEPWPIEIDDHDGVLKAVDLKEGQVLWLMIIMLVIVVLNCNDASLNDA